MSRWIKQCIRGEQNQWALYNLAQPTSPLWFYPSTQQIKYTVRIVSVVKLSELSELLEVLKLSGLFRFHGADQKLNS